MKYIPSLRASMIYEYIKRFNFEIWSLPTECFLFFKFPGLQKAREEQESLESGNNDPGTFTDEDQESPMSNINTLLTNGKSHGQPVINLTMHQNSNKNGYQYDFDFSQPTEGRKFSMRNLKRRLTLGALKTRENGANSVGQVVKKVKKNASSYMIDKVFRILFPLVFATYNIFYFKEYIHHKLTVN